MVTIAPIKENAIYFAASVKPSAGTAMGN